MKANEFLKEHGFQYTRNLVRDYPNHTHVTDDGRMFINENTCASHIKVQLNELVKIDELKRLVESHNLVEKVGGMDKAKMLLRMRIAAELYESADEIEKAIADVEACKGVL